MPDVVSIFLVKLANCIKWCFHFKKDLETIHKELLDSFEDSYDPHPSTVQNVFSAREYNLSISRCKEEKTMQGFEPAVLGGLDVQLLDK